MQNQSNSSPRKAQNVKVIKDSLNPKTAEVMADSIIDISRASKALLNQGLTKHGLVILIQGMPGVKLTKSQIETVLDNLPKLASYYTKQKLI